jgi:hypothetical protein
VGSDRLRCVILAGGPQHFLRHRRCTRHAVFCIKPQAELPSAHPADRPLRAWIFAATAKGRRGASIVRRNAMRADGHPAPRRIMRRLKADFQATRAAHTAMVVTRPRPGHCRNASKTCRRTCGLLAHAICGTGRGHAAPRSPRVSPRGRCTRCCPEPPGSGRTLQATFPHGSRRCETGVPWRRCPRRGSRGEASLEV